MPKTISEIMTTRVATVKPETCLDAIVKAFERHPFHHLPVAGADGRIVGLVSDRDLMRACVSGRFEAGKPCSAIMSTMIASVPAEATIKEAAQRLVKLGVNSLLILDDGRLMGIVTTRDLVKTIAADA